MSEEYGAVIVGGGFYGASIALYLAGRGERVVILEKGADLLARASYVNQARVHNGYHYPRSILTSLRSRVNYTRFLADFPDCVDESFQKVYAIARHTSKVTGTQFLKFCRRIGAPASPAPREVRALFNPHLVEAVFATTECAFNSVKLKEAMLLRLAAAGVEVRTGVEVERAPVAADGRGVEVFARRGGEEERLNATLLFNCTYSHINQLLTASDLAPVPLKHELAEMALVEVPEALRGLGVTVMDGPFFSCMPFPSRGLHSLSHVRYTPHRTWHDGAGEPYMHADTRFRAGLPRSHAPYMVRDAQRYLPLMAECRHLDSIWEIKTVLPRSEVDDSRPILLKRSSPESAVFSVLGAKIDSVYDVQESLEEMLPPRMSA